jgi:hypothetical protein
MSTKSDSEKLKGLIETMNKSQVGIFADRDTPQEAFEYAEALGRAEGITPSVMATAIYVYHNTLLKALLEIAEG